MKQKLKRRNRLSILVVCLSLIFYQCQQDDLQTIEEQNNLETTTLGQKTNKLVSGKDIPEILDFVKQQTNDRLQVKLSDISGNTRQADLPIGNLSTDVVKQVTNQYGRSNYTFTMVKDVDTGELSYINYVVKDTRYGVYGYFVEYIPEILIQHQGDPLPDTDGYSGEIRIYNQYGVYIGSNTFENGNKTSDNYRHSCDNDTDGGSGGGGGNTGDGTGPSGPSSGDGSGSGGGGVDITFVCGEVYLQEIDCPPNCECTACFIEIQDCDIIVRTSDDYYNKTGKRDPLRHPCPPIDTSEQNCRCPDDVPDGQTDVDPQDENPNDGIIFDLGNFIELSNELDDNPFYLLEIDCNQLPNWQTLAQHTAPQSVQDKIENLPSGTFNDFEIQSLQDAGGTAVNLDFFSVNISSLPNNPNTGQQFTADEFQDYSRRNINDFVDGSTFEPYCEISSICQQETDLWNSTNPLGALVYIDIPFDDGVVVLTEYTNSYWYFMTMNAPFAGNHPVSGTRQFGYETNTDGSINFFIRGVDRFDSNLVENLSYIRGGGNPFFGADDLWESFQNKVNDFVNNNGGTSSINNPIKNRPDWDKVQEVLEGDRPVSDLGCN